MAMAVALSFAGLVLVLCAVWGPGLPWRACLCEVLAGPVPAECRRLAAVLLFAPGCRRWCGWPRWLAVCGGGGGLGWGQLQWSLVPTLLRFLAEGFIGWVEMLAGVPSVLTGCLGAYPCFPRLGCDVSGVWDVPRCPGWWGCGGVLVWDFGSAGWSVWPVVGVAVWGGGRLVGPTRVCGVLWWPVVAWSGAVWSVGGWWACGLWCTYVGCGAVLRYLVASSFVALCGWLVARCCWVSVWCVVVAGVLELRVR